MNPELSNPIIENITKQTTIKKFLEEDLIYQMINYFNKEIKKLPYPSTITNHLDIVLEFIHQYNIDYYNLIIEGLNTKRIIISNQEESYTDTQNNQAYIQKIDNDSLLFVLVHEFAHYIDRNSNPQIIPNEYNFLCEVFSFYFEKKLELWLNNSAYAPLIKVRQNNRFFVEHKMLTAIKYQLFYEKLYLKNHKISEKDIDPKKMKALQKYAYIYNYNTGLINYLLRYPLGNLLSEYLIQNNLLINDYDLPQICLNTDLYQVLKKSNLASTI